MPRPLSIDLRKRIIDAKLRGDTEKKISCEKSVNKSTVTKLWSLYRVTVSYSPRSNPNVRKPVLSAQELEQIGECILRQPDITLWELKEKFSLAVSISALSRTIKGKLGFHFKKKRYTPTSKIVKTSK